MDSKKQMSFI
jgi:glutaminase